MIALDEWEVEISPPPVQVRHFWRCPALFEVVLKFVTHPAAAGLVRVFRVEVFPGAGQVQRFLGEFSVSDAEFLAAHALLRPPDRVVRETADYIFAAIPEDAQKRADAVLTPLLN